ncbi:response regulator transcription factor [Pseudoneobacillus sp. C159]
MKRILLAEDEEIIRMLIMDTLEDEEYQVDEAADGEEAMKLFAEDKYDLLILDYMMPGLTGIEVIEKVREGHHNQTVKILMLSAKSQQYEQDKILSVGADEFMAKPFSPLQLIEKIKDIFNEY